MRRDLGLGPGSGSSVRLTWREPSDEKGFAMSTVTRLHLARSLHRSLLAPTLVVALGSASVLLASPITAHAASRVAHASSVCDKVSAASVSAIVGYKVPAATEYTVPVKPSKTDYEVTGSDVHLYVRSRDVHGDHRQGNLPLVRGHQ